MGALVTNRYLTKSELKSERGWTDRLIKRFLGPPDVEEVNPHYKSGPPMCLYSLKRVRRKEKTVTFQREFAKTEKRRESCKKAIATREARTEAFVDSLEVNLPKIPWQQLVEMACNSYNERARERSDFDRLATLDSDPEFLRRISVNFLRHEVAQYDTSLTKVHGAVGSGFARLDIKEKVLDAISEQYPELQEECTRQYQRSLSTFYSDQFSSATR